MSNLRDIRRRINSVKNTQKITRAMKMVAAAKLRRAQEAVVAARPYAQQMRALVTRVAACSQDTAHPLLGGREEKRSVLVVVTADRGLCGPYNSSIVNETKRLLNGPLSDREVSLVVVGRKGIDGIKRQNVTIDERFTHVLEDDPLRAVAKVFDPLVDRFVAGEIDAVHIVYNAFKSAISQVVTLEQLLPVTIDEKAESPPVEYTYEPDQTAVLETLLQRDLRIQLHRVLHEAAASEHGARMTAMDAATKNASEVIDTLTLQYNRARQDAITSEMLEIIGGAEAL
jgi:F-type H+-transporting ATPase subunit gamma